MASFQQILFILVSLTCLCIYADDVTLRQSISHDEKVEETQRKAKLFPVFQVVTFPNKVCTGSSTRNGTCYTTAECTAKGGSSSGTCAQGYGVCCIFTLSCGGTTSQNCSYLVQASTTKAPATTCAYTICRCNDNICRIRLDFTTFNIASPQTGTTSATTTTGSIGGGIGDCITDSFSLSSPGNTGSPVICGFNTGQHMIVDASDSCSVANFDIGSSGDTRQWDIKVTQYACGDEQGGPEGCLQYFTGSSGRVSSYNFPTTSSTIGASTTHLSSQCYTICFRQEVGKCSICFTTAIGATATAIVAATQVSFGLSINSQDTVAAMQSSNAACTSDYVVIPNAETTTALASTQAAGLDRICGRIFSATNQDTNYLTSVCSRTKPFRMSFKTDANEVATTTATMMGTMNEQSLAPGGIVGFSLNFVEQSC